MIATTLVTVIIGAAVSFFLHECARLVQEVRRYVRLRADEHDFDKLDKLP